MNGRLESIPTTKIPAVYQTARQESIETAHGTQVYSATMDCSHTIGAEVMVCAELVNDWQWSHKMVKFSLHSDKNVSSVLSVMLRDITQIQELFLDPFLTNQYEIMQCSSLSQQ